MLLCCFDIDCLKKARAPAGVDAAANIHNDIKNIHIFKVAAVCLSFTPFSVPQLPNHSRI
jgi:hypothetical protein